MFKQLVNSPDVLDAYDRIKNNENHKANIKHDLSHVLNVVNNVENILRQLSVGEEFIEAAKISALLHDIGCVQGQENHAFNSYVWASNYFKEHNMILPYHTEVLHAIRDHSDFYDSISFMTLVLILADKLDITKERLTNLGKNVPGIRQLQYVENVDILINKDQLNININTNHDINYDELKDLESVNKIKSAILALSKHQNLQPKITINHHELYLEK